MKKIDAVILFIITITFAFFPCCKHNEDITLQARDEALKDSLFFFSHIPKHDNEFEHMELWNTLIKNKIYISIHEARGKNIFFIKEIQKDSIRRFYYETSQIQFFYSHKYDSIESDLETIALRIYKEGNIFFLDSLSSSFFNIHKIRQKDTVFQNLFIKRNIEIKQIESIVNNMEIFENFSFENNIQMEILKELIFYFRISMIHCNGFSSPVSHYIFDPRTMKQIKNENDFSEFLNRLDTSSTDTTFLKILSYWEKNNHKFLLSNIQKIKDNYQKNNVIIYYSITNDLKVFIYTINLKNGNILIEENYLNKDYIWQDPNIGVKCPW
jgi:hypothetical protein